MKTLYFKKSVTAKHRLNINLGIALFFFSIITQVSPSFGQAVLFDFDSAPLYTPLPISQTVSGITAHFSATGAGYSIQDVSAPVVPVGFTGRFIYPSSINLSDLLIRFDQTITDFSIKYSTQELACDDAATMRVTAYMNGNFVVTNTKMTSHPGTWPVDTLSCSFPSGFDSVVVHYASPPPTCPDYGVIFLADNMRVTALPVGISNQEMFISKLTIQNPVSQSTSLLFSLNHIGNIDISIYDISGRLIKNLFTGALNTGEHKIYLDINDDAIKGGIYFLNLTSDNFSQSLKLVVIK